MTVFDGRPNSELILATGRVEDDSPSDYLTISVGLVQADRMYSTKKEILKAMGFEGVQVCTRCHICCSLHPKTWHHKQRCTIRAGVQHVQLQCMCILR